MGFLHSWEGNENQIDLLIERADRLINLCECKFSAREFIIDKEYDRKLRERQAAFMEETKTHYATIMTLSTKCIAIPWLAAASFTMHFSRLETAFLCGKRLASDLIMHTRELMQIVCEKC